MSQSQKDSAKKKAEKNRNYSIHEVSHLAGISTRTLRYYDSIGLLKPEDVNEAGVRFYGEHELTLLQQILFYRERGMELREIRNILYQKDFDVMEALSEHLAQLQAERERMDALIDTVQKTIASMKGEYKMSSREKFEAFKKQMVAENEEKYGAEIRKKYGDEEVDASNKKMFQMSEEDYKRFKDLEDQILEKLQAAVKAGNADKIIAGEAGKEIFNLHKAWIGMAWRTYTPQAHKGVAAMYVADERFTGYYDKEVKGCAELLKEIIWYWA